MGSLYEDKLRARRVNRLMDSAGIFIRFIPSAVSGVCK